ncbi:hypothetical protein GGR51DRAFT_506241 [Nemania sp. FL0031]|nr:hypothetical protein GGR51DRAFT_506241 [Nemania sp. FL0031]
MSSSSGEPKGPQKSTEGPTSRPSDDDTHHDDEVVFEEYLEEYSRPGASVEYRISPISEQLRQDSGSNQLTADWSVSHKDSYTSPGLGSAPQSASLPPSSTSPLHEINVNVCCEICGYRPKGDPRWFAGSMAKHKKMQHSNAMPIIYKCPFPGCNSQYKNRRDNLRQHQIEKNHFVGDDTHQSPKRRHADDPIPKAEAISATTNPTCIMPSARERNDTKDYNTQRLPSISDLKIALPLPSPRETEQSQAPIITSPGSQSGETSFVLYRREVDSSTRGKSVKGQKRYDKLELRNEGDSRPSTPSTSAIMRLQSKSSQSSATESDGQMNCDEVFTDSEHSPEPDITELDDICNNNELLSPAQEKLLQIIMCGYFATRGLDSEANGDELTYLEGKPLSPSTVSPYYSSCLRSLHLHPSELYTVQSPTMKGPKKGSFAFGLSTAWAKRFRSYTTSFTPYHEKTTPNSVATSSLCSLDSSGQAKRKITDPSDTTQDPENSKVANSSNKRHKNKDTRQVLACPYWKLDSEKYRSCCKLSHKRIRDVKQHLHRRHTPEYYCPRCFETFDDSQRYEAHVASPLPCQRQTGGRLDGISIAQDKELRKKSDRKLDEEQQWFAIWDILFPNQPRPCSAYVDLALSEELSSFKEYWTRRGEDILMNEMNSTDLWSLSAEQREAQGRVILRRGLTMIYEQWEERRLLSDPLTPDTSSSDSPATQLADIHQNEPVPAPLPENLDFGVNTFLPCIPFPGDHTVNTSGSIIPSFEFGNWLSGPNDLDPSLPNQGYDDIYSIPPMIE